MPLYLRFIHLAPQPSLLAERGEEIVPAEACAQVQMLGDLGHCAAGAAETQHLALIVYGVRTFSEGMHNLSVSHAQFQRKQCTK